MSPAAGAGAPERTGPILLTGPVSSGKSRLATEIAARWVEEDPRRTVEVVVTAEGLDDEMRTRIARHRADRPAGWLVREAPLALADALAAVEPSACAIVDCLTLWTANRLGAGDDPERVFASADEIADVAAARHGPTVIVTNEVGWGIVPVNDLARAYRDVLGRVNAVVASRAVSAWLVVAGRVLRLEAPGPGGTMLP